MNGRKGRGIITNAGAWIGRKSYAASDGRRQLDNVAGHTSLVVFQRPSLT